VAEQDCQKTTIKPNSYGLDEPPNNPGISATKSVMGGKKQYNCDYTVLARKPAIDVRHADPFTLIDPKLNQVVPWSLHTFPENFMQIGPAVFS